SESPDAGAAGYAADVDIGGLEAVGQRVDQPAAIGRAVEEIERTAGGTEGEASVRGRAGEVVVAIEQEETAGGQRRAGSKDEFAGSIGIIAEAEVGKADGIGEGVEELDPVGGGASEVGQGAVAGEDFVEDDRHAD